MPQVLVEADNVHRHFRSGGFGRRDAAVLRGVGLSVREGQTLGVVGPSGAGKTTLGRIVAGIDAPNEGRVRYRGKDIRQLSGAGRRHFRRKVQMLFQDPEGALNPARPVGHALAEMGRLVNADRTETDRTIGQMLRTVGLSPEILSRPPGRLSGGQNQRVALARILMLEPELIVLDEPTSALDVSVQAQILHLLKALQRERNMAYLFISHHSEVVRFMCDSVISL